MRLNRVKFQEIMSKKNLTEDIICHRTGLTSRSLRWIMNNGEVSEDALERIADAAEVETREIYLSDIAAFNDNVIEFLKGSERATVTFSQGRYKSRIKNWQQTARKNVRSWQKIRMAVCAPMFPPLG